MPIRTNRGRTAVYRRLWGWPLRSPRHLATALILFFALVVVVGFVIPNALGPRSTANPAGTTTPATGATSRGNQIGVLPTVTTSPLPTKAPSPTPAGTSVPVDPNARLVADGWIDAYSDYQPGKTTKEQWLDGLKAFTADELFPRLQSVEPANVPVVIDQAVTAAKSFPDSAEFEAKLESGKLVVTVARLPEGWRVQKYTKVG
ncbi:hypothetical protein ACFFSW_29345 [Saccharothrix longispora]|uniref:Mce-associated membrane protein n=1 Tax=Saccharothrix longispora TaxID=33920 RepID=A0ABU1Q5Y7_9PSEU|nr:hypothetical protein [Saccharothrix longispora]MDR6598306.1 hypothetical protein [Saccharothrix longispora]